MAVLVAGALLAQRDLAEAAPAALAARRVAWMGMFAVTGALFAVTTLVVVFLQRRFGRPPLASAAACASPTRLTVLEGGRRTR